MLITISALPSNKPSAAVTCVTSPKYDLPTTAVESALTSVSKCVIVSVLQLGSNGVYVGISTFPLPKIFSPFIVLTLVPETKVSCFVPKPVCNSESVA